VKWWHSLWTVLIAVVVVGFNTSFIAVASQQQLPITKQYLHLPVRHVEITMPAIGSTQTSQIDAPTPFAYPTLSLGSSSTATRRLQQLLAEQHDLPLTFTSKQVIAKTMPAQQTAISSPPQGQFRWTYQNTPQTLQSLWTPGLYGVMTKGAVMTFERKHQLAIDGIVGPQVWQALLADELVNHHALMPYTYVLINEYQPETLTIWEDGKIVLTSHVNTGIEQSPTAIGTYPVYLRYTSQTMKGKNPDGSTYSDVGVPWISYFYGGDAVHGFVRTAYGYPQSLGCAELPIATAAKAYRDMQFGTLVTVVK